MAALNFTAGPAPRRQRSAAEELERARAALFALDPGCDRETWVRAAMAAKAAGLDEGDFLAWSEGAPNFDSARDCRSVWRSIRQDGGIGAGTLFALARAAGWSDEPAGMNGRPTFTDAPRRPQEPAGGPQFDVAGTWASCEPATPAHGYVARKLGLCDGLRVVPADSPLRIARRSVAGWLAVPLFDGGAGDEPASLQFIGPDAGKLTAPGPMRGWFTVGGRPTPGATVYVCEGVGQAWSAHQATRTPAVVAFGAGRMESVARGLLERVPGVRVVLVADVGTESKVEASAKALGCAWVAPPADLGRNGDANDLHQRDGLDAVAALLAQAREPARPEYAALADLDSNPPPPRRWIVPEWLPRGSVTALFGGGGIGKSLLVQQIATYVANGIGCFGQAVTMGPALGFLCEDDPDEIRRRQRAILANLGRSAAYSAQGLYLQGRAGMDNVLMTFGPDRVPAPGPFLPVVERECDRIRPALLILDNIAQLFGGLENDRHEVTVFANRLTGIARRFDCAVLLLGHVAKAQGSEFSGSTAWEAAVRTRLWMERRDDGLIELHKRKANYSGQESVSFEYRDGALAEVDTRSDSAADSLLMAQAQTLVLELLAQFTARQVATSHHPTARNNLVRLAQKEGRLNGAPQVTAERALAALIDAGRIVPNAELGWRGSDRHKARGLALAGAVQAGDADSEANE